MNILDYQRICGVWKLKELKRISSSGKVDYPFGRNPQGMITYTSEGIVSVAIISEKAIENEASENLEVCPINIDDYIQYFGRFSINGGTVMHYPFISYDLRDLGKRFLRYFHFESSNLILETEPEYENDTKVSYILVWEKYNDTIFMEGGVDK